MKRYLLILCFLAVAVTASAAWMDQLQKLADPESKERKILSGTTQVLSSSKEIDYITERTIGEALALESMQRFGKPVAKETMQQYVNLVGAVVAQSSLRSTIPYHFTVLDSSVQNAFAAPGGMIFISKALLETLTDEAELAAVLAHEIGHVAAKHALKSTQRAQFLQGVGTITAATSGGKGKEYQALIGDLQNKLFDQGLDKSMEFEADLAAMETSYRAGYNPLAMIRVLERLQKLEASSVKKGSWFSTHPPLKERIARLKREQARYPDAATLAELPERFRGKMK
ncbi:MAG: M48 family metallopeptidase [Desulfuromonadales bacterium]|nr:M48 family metallopeptidase [Desulfuromonadales bacterium]